jgi:hypothetical protein
VRFPFGEPVTVLREQRNAATGVSVLVDDRVIDGCAVYPVGQETNDPERAWVETRRTAVTPPGCGLRAGDRVRLVDGSVWEVAVDADPWRSPLTGWVPGDQVKLRQLSPST